MMNMPKPSERRIRHSSETFISRLAVGAGLLVSTLAFQTAFAQAENTGKGMEYLNAQMQQQAAPAAAAAAPAVPNPNCTLIVPAHALSAAGLATPYQLVATDPAQGPCNEANAMQSAFVQGAIFDPATNTISVYNPLVIDKGTNALEPPTKITLPDGAIVALWFGFNGNNLTLQGANGGTLQNAHCTNGANGSIFGQFSYCNAHAFFKAANAAIAAGNLQIPALGTANDGKPCPTVRDFFVVDQDQSDNVTTTYLQSIYGHFAQNTAKNRAAHPTATPIGNPSDNRLTDVFVQPALGCTPVMAPDLADPGAMVPALPLNELQARAGQGTPVAFVPAGDPMTQINMNTSIFKLNLYRRGVDQPKADSFDDADTARYCRNLLRIFPQRLTANQAALSNFKSPDAGAANSLFTFLGQRFVATYQLLNCAALINQANPVSVTLTGAVATAVNINTGALNQAVQALAASQAEDNAKDAAAKSLLTHD
jgi:hypothetical protein